MARFSQTIDGKYGVKTYQETKKTYDWIVKAIAAGNYLSSQKQEDFYFSIGGINCSCKSIAEFTENAYGQENFSLISLTVTTCDKKGNIISFSVHDDGKIWVSTYSKIVLDDMINLLMSTNLSSTEVNDPKAVTYIENQNNGVFINGNKNRVTQAQNINTPQTSKWRQLIASIFQNLIANGIWYLVIASGSALITYFAMK